MKVKPFALSPAVVQASLAAQRENIRFCRALLDQLEEELDQLGEEADTKRKSQTVFENFDQKANQLFNLLSTVMKNMKEMSQGISRNIT